MDNPALSFIVPVYNGEKYLSKALNSILHQPNQDLEIIIVDDGSVDSSAAIADRFAAEYDRIHVIHKTNSGVAAARNAGIAFAKGIFVGFLDADDVLCKNVFTDEICQMLRSGDYDMLDFAYFLGADDLSRGRLVSCSDGSLIRKEDAPVLVSWKHFCSSLYRRSLLTGHYCFPEGCRVNEDVVFLFLFHHRAHRIMQYSKPWFIYRRNIESVMHAHDEADILLSIGKAWYWCKPKCEKQEERNICDGIIFSNMVQYIRYSCHSGVPISKIQEMIYSNTAFQEAKDNLGNYWVSKELLDFYKMFVNCPEKARRNKQLKGKMIRLMKWISRTRAGAKLYEAFQYRISLKGYLP